MKQATLSLLAAMSLAALAGPAHAAATFTYLFSDGYPLSMSTDGSAVAGNNVSDFGPFRWTQATGRVELGRASVPVVGRSAGTATISDDGKRVASTIHSDDSTLVTAGCWTLGQDWQELPVPPDAASIDNDLASVWGMSGDGQVVVGLYWRRGQPGGSAHGYSWSQATGPVDLGATARSSRANGVNYDGSVIAGFDEHPVQGFRRACAWVNGQLFVLGATDQPGEAHTTNSFGTIVGGYQRDPATDLRKAAIWKRNGSVFGPTQFLGALPGTEPSYGLNRVEGVSADGQMAVGYTTFAGDPYGTTGFVWTESGGIVDVNQFLADHGILPDPAFSIATLQDISADGRRILGWGRDVLAPYTIRAFMIDLDPTVDVAVGAGGLPLRVVARPNPVRDGTTLHFELPGSDAGTVSIYDSTGRLVRRLVDGTMSAGPHRVAWDRRDASGARVASGVYYSRLETHTNRAIGKLVVLQ